MNDALSYVVRPAQANEYAYISETLNGSLKNAYPWGWAQGLPTFDLEATRLWHVLFERFTPQPWVAVTPDSTVLAFSLHSPNKLLWLYTRKAFRRQGIATNMLSVAFPGRQPFTHMMTSKDFAALAATLKQPVTFNPFTIVGNQ